MDGRDSNWGIFSAGAVVLAVLGLALLFLLQRNVVSGMTSGNVT